MEIINLIKAEEYNITGRGRVLAIKFTENNLEPMTANDVSKMFMNQVVVYQGEPLQVKGIEMFAIDRNMLQNQCGLLVNKHIDLSYEK